LAIATTRHRVNVEALLRHTLPAQCAALFDAIVAGDEVSEKKPDPEVFEAALRKLGLPAADCVGFEDSANGADAARGAGLRVVVTPGIYTADDDFSGASSVVSDLGEPGRPHRHLARSQWPDGYVSFCCFAKEVRRIARLNRAAATGHNGIRPTKKSHTLNVPDARTSRCPRAPATHVRAWPA
jgi:hypothetical protein